MVNSILVQQLRSRLKELNVDQKLAVVDRTLLKHAAIGAVMGVLAGFLYGAAEWLFGLAFLGAALALIAEFFDHTLYRLPVAAGDNRYKAASKTLLAFWAVCMSVIGMLIIWIA